jgi:hypothetical protein
MRHSALGLSFVGLVAIAACAGKSPGSGLEPDGGSSGRGGGAQSSSSSGSGSSSGSAPGMFGMSDAGPAACKYMDAIDHDGDGFSSVEGDCNDCNPNMNPGAFDVPMNGIDEDCDGIVDDEPTGCDKNAVLDSTDPFNAALAMDICRKTTETAQGHQRTWGVTSARFMAPDGTDDCVDMDSGQVYSCVNGAPNFALGHGNLTKLGPNLPKQGTHMLGLSSGTARDPSDPGYEPVALNSSMSDCSVGGFDKMWTTGFPTGYPVVAPACPSTTPPSGQPHDGMALQLVIRVPTNAQSFTFDENFFTGEFPIYVCSEFNDQYITQMSPAPMGAGPGGNVSFDSKGDVICVNNALLQACVPQNAYGIDYACPLGPSSLASTGFTDAGDSSGAATGWLQTQVSVEPSLKGKDITLTFVLWDSGDGCLDSTILVDNLQWSTMPGSPTPVTQPAQ